jgi:hypothetical protein
MDDVDSADPTAGRFAGSRRPDRLQSSGRAVERSGGLGASKPDPGTRSLNRLRIVLDHEKREANVARREIRVTGDDGNVLALPLHQRAQRA